jgi:hypothetical protein
VTQEEKIKEKPFTAESYFLKYVNVNYKDDSVLPPFLSLRELNCLAIDKYKHLHMYICTDMEKREGSSGCVPRPVCFL